MLASTLLGLLRVQSQVPGIISYQGKLTVHGTNYTGEAHFRFALVDAAGTLTYWSHDGTSTAGGEPFGPPIQLSVTRGIFSVNLGDTRAIPGTVFQNQEVYLRVWVDDGTHGLQQLSPDTRIAAAAYALTAGRLAGPAAEALVASSFTGTLAGDVTGSQNATAVARVGGKSAAEISSAVADVALATSENVPGMIVRRSGSGHVAAGVFTGTFIGNGSGLILDAGRLSGAIPNEVLESSMPAGLTVVSTLLQDPSLLAKGYSKILTVPPPSWTTSSSDNPPSARTGHTALWDGEKVLIWGGSINSGNQPVNTGGIYLTDAETWESISTLNAPEARTAHTAVWTGTEMIVWGGNGQAEVLGTGGSFNSTTRAWRSVSTVNAPSARSGHIAVWTGRFMIVWGGQGPAGLLNDGGLYDPARDAWSQIALTDPPEPRYGAAAVWAGDRVLIWGGHGAQGVLASGSQLILSPELLPLKWSSIPLLSSPSARRFHTAIWTGQKMIVWGGERDGLALGDGAAFSPVTALWETLSASNAPSARFRHSAVCTGQEMLVVGGTTGSVELSSGAALDLATGQWRSLSTSGAPRPRFDAGAAWTGAELIVFGGLNAGQTVGALQRLVPQPAWHFYRKL